MCLGTMPWNCRWCISLNPGTTRRWGVSFTLWSLCPRRASDNIGWEPMWIPQPRIWN